MLQKRYLHFKAVLGLVHVEVHEFKQASGLQLLVHVTVNINAACSDGVL